MAHAASVSIVDDLLDFQNQNEVQASHADENPRDHRTSDMMSETSECTTTTTSSDLNSEQMSKIASILGIANVYSIVRETFRVNRRTLESMVNEEIEGSPKHASTFFHKIMDETNTFIKWPVTLKSKSRSKKDPSVSIYGLKSNIETAKGKIIPVLDTTDSKVILKMDVSYTDHSHIIGKEGSKIKMVMSETGCHIHFPDGNRNKFQEKSNQVSIAGEIDGVEQARIKIRNLTPLIFVFEVPLCESFINPTNFMMDPGVIKIQKDYNVQISLRGRTKLYSMTVGVKGSEWELLQIKQATLTLMKHLRKELPKPAVVRMILEIAPQNQALVQGEKNINLHLVMQATSTQIIFPDANDPNIPTIKKSRVSIVGEIDNVYEARQRLINLLPLVLMFEISEHVMNRLNTTKVFQLAESFNLKITYRNKVKKNSFCVIIKGFEQDSRKLYEARREIINCTEEIPVVRVPPGFSPKNLPQPSTDSTSKFIPPTDHYNKSRTLPFPSPITSSFLPSGLNPIGLGLRSPFWNSPAYPQMCASNYYYSRVMNANSQVQTNESIQESILTNQQPLQSQNLYRKSSFSSHNDSGNSSISLDLSPRRNSDLGKEFLSNKSLDGWYSLFSNELEQKKLQGYRAMNSKMNDGETRVPTSIWGGYGLSQTAPPATEVSSYVKNLWDDSKSSNFSLTNDNQFGMNSNYLEHTPASRIDRILSESVDDIPALLTVAGLEKYIRLFRMNEIDMFAFRQMSDADLKSLGIDAWGARRKILLLIAECNKRAEMYRRVPDVESQEARSSEADSSKQNFAYFSHQ